MVRCLCFVGWAFAALLLAAHTPLRATEQSLTPPSEDVFPTAEAVRTLNGTAINAARASRAAVTSAIREAALRTGVDFQYLMVAAQIESGLDPRAKARTSSASGLFQFIESTWLASLARHSKPSSPFAPPGVVAHEPVLGAPGASREALLALRFDPRMAALVAAAETAENERVLRRVLGRDATAAELYMAHFLGSAGAARFLRVWRANPHAIAAQMFPRAARANAPIFYTDNGRARSLEAVRDAISDKIRRETERLSKVGSDVGERHGGLKISTLEQGYMCHISQNISKNSRSLGQALPAGAGTRNVAPLAAPGRQLLPDCGVALENEINQFDRGDTLHMMRGEIANLLIDSAGGNGTLTVFSQANCDAPLAVGPCSLAAFRKTSASGANDDRKAANLAPAPGAQPLQKPENPLQSVRPDAQSSARPLHHHPLA